MEKRYKLFFMSNSISKLNMSTESATQATEINADQSAAKLATAPSQTTPATPSTAKKAVRKVAQKAPQKAGVKATVKASVKAPLKAKRVVAKKPAQKPAAEAKAKPIAQKKTQEKAEPTPASKPLVEPKPKKPKLVRDSFTFPKDEYQAIAGMKQKALGLKHSAKKSEILRAGLKLLNSLNDKAFLAALNSVPALKTGRPAKS